MRHKRLRLMAVIAIVFSILANSVLATEDNSDTNNRYNVMFVVDASGSMRSTDPDGYRFEAIKLFASLLANGGNYLGGVVFNEDILEVIDPAEMKSSSDKSEVTEAIENVNANGDTNIGLALDTAIDSLLDDADPSLPSVILFLSDGNTDLPSESEIQESLDQKADAIQRARDNGIAMCSVCLNRDGSADISEMEQISSATGGLFIEVEDAEDLDDAFNAFYTFIYGSSTIDCGEFTVPDNGVVETTFDVPGLGVEEVNIIVYGVPSESYVIKPDGTVSDVEVTTFGSTTTLKVIDVEPGIWTLQVVGVPGAQIRINMVYNTDMDLRVDYPDFAIRHYNDEQIVIRASLSSGGLISDSADQLSSFTAELHLLDAYGEEIDSYPMTTDGGSFVYSSTLPNGTYRLYVTVDGNYISQSSEVVGPLVIVDAPRGQSSESMEAEPIENDPPEPVEDVYEYTYNIWPFAENKFQIDLNGLAEDDEDDELVYRIDSSSFMDGDYKYDEDDGIITIKDFSLSKGAFTIAAYDSEGLSCEFEVIVISHNIGIMMLIGIGAAALVALIIIGVITYILLNKRFMGACLVCAFDESGDYDEKSRKKGRGRLYLKSFAPLPDVGLDLNKCYFQASGKNFVYLVSKKPIYGDGRKGKKFQISSMPVEISADADRSKGVKVSFQSDLNKDPFFG